MNPTEILVTSYMSPDLDGFACAYAYTEFLNKQNQRAILGISGEPHEEAKFLLKQYNIPFVPQSFNPADFARIILVDASDLQGIDPRINPDQVIEVIDHRKVNEMEAFKNAKVQVEMVGSAATLIAEKFIGGKVVMSRDAAVLLYGAIVSNTLNFKANITTDRDRNVAAWLAAFIHPPADFVMAMFAAKSNVTKENLSEAIDHDFASFDLSKRVGVGQLEMIGAEEFVAQLKPDILGKLEFLKQTENFDLIFLSVVDLEKGQNIFITADQSSQELLTSIFGFQFTDNAAIRPGLILRKEIMPLIKEKLV